MTPQPHTSTGLPYGSRFTTSGAMKCGVPTRPGVTETECHIESGNDSGWFKWIAYLKICTHTHTITLTGTSVFFSNFYFYALWTGKRKCSQIPDLKPVTILSCLPIPSYDIYNIKCSPAIKCTLWQFSIFFPAMNLRLHKIAENCFSCLRLKRNFQLLMCKVKWNCFSFTNLRTPVTLFWFYCTSTCRICRH